MKFLIPVLLLTLSLCTCDSAEESNKPLPNFGRADRAIVYDDFDAIEPLFQQDSDTTYLINFWATWCKPCREEIKLLQRLEVEDHSKPLKIVLVSLDREEGTVEKVAEFLKENGPDLSSIILTDPDDATWGKTIDRVWSGSLPTTIIYRGELRYVYRRAFNTFADLERAVEPMVK